MCKRNLPGLFQVPDKKWLKKKRKEAGLHDNK